MLFRSDLIANGDQSFAVRLSNATGGANVSTNAAKNTATLTVLDDESSVTISNFTYTVSESNKFVAITLVRSGALQVSGSVDFTTTNDFSGGPLLPPGLARSGSVASQLSTNDSNVGSQAETQIVSMETAGIGLATTNDYRSTNGTVVFPPNVKSKTILVPILEDTVVDGTKSFGFQISNPAGGVQLGATANAQIIILDDDLGGALSFSANSYPASEGSTNAVITLVRRQGLASGIAVDFHTADVTAAAGVDYSNATQTVTFNAGETNKKVLVPLINNSVITDEKFVLLTLDNPTGGASVGEPSTVNLIITEDDLGGTIRFARTNYSAAESAPNFTVNVIRTGGLADRITVDYFTESGTATEDVDFTRTNGTLFFAAGETNKIITVGLLNDTVREGVENFKLRLANATGGGTVGAADTAELVIVDDESSISISNATATVGEGDGKAIVTLVRSGPLNSVVSVNFFTTNGTAHAGVEYRATNGAVTFSNNVSIRTVAVTILDNTTVGENKTFIVALSNAPAGTPLGTTHSQAITIVDNDSGGKIEFATNSVAGFQGTNVAVRVIRTGGIAGGVSVPVSLGDGTAIAGIDYVNLSPTVTFNAGETSKTVLIALPFNAASTNGSEIFLTLGPPGGGATLGGLTTALLTIRYQAEPGTVPAAGDVFFKASVDGVTLSNLVLTVTNYFPNLGTGSPFVEITAQKTENSGTVSNKVIELGFQFLKATGVGPVNFPDASTANGVFFYNVTPNFGVTLLAYSGQFGTGGSVNIDVLNPATKTIAGRFNLVVKELLTGFAHTNTGSFRVRW